MSGIEDLVQFGLVAETTFLRFSNQLHKNDRAISQESFARAQQDPFFIAFDIDFQDVNRRKILGTKQIVFFFPIAPLPGFILTQCERPRVWS